jgi:regulatory protein
MVITRIRKVKSGDRFAIDLDSVYGFSVQQNTLIQESLFVGLELSQQEVDRIIAGDLKHYLIEKALLQIASRPRSGSELGRYLSTKADKWRGANNKEQILKEVTAYLMEKGYINDDDFTEWWIDNRKAFKTKSKSELRLELRQKGIDTEIIEKYLEKMVSDQGQLENLAALIAKKANYFKMRTSAPQEARAKMTQFLLRKGYSWELIKQALSNI